MVSNGCLPGWLEANDTWSAGCQSWVSTTFGKRAASRSIGAMTASPSATARLPPGRKSFWRSTTTRQSSARSGGIGYILRNGGAAFHQDAAPGARSVGGRGRRRGRVRGRSRVRSGSSRCRGVGGRGLLLLLERGRGRRIDQHGAFDHGEFGRAAAGQLLGDLVLVGRGGGLDLVVGETGLLQRVAARAGQGRGIFGELVGGGGIALGAGLRLDQGERGGAPQRLVGVIGDGLGESGHRGAEQRQRCEHAE